jgi:hypothetical protein
MSEPKSGSKALGCIGLIAVIILIAWATQDAGCNSSQQQQSDAERLLKETMGSNNPMAKRISILTQGNAYQAGLSDGAKEVSAIAIKQNWSRYDYHQKLQEYREGKRIAFDALGSQNNFNQVVFDEYRRGWDYGASTVTVQ